MSKVLLNIDLPFLPSDFDVEEIDNPITGEKSSNIFGKVIINGVVYNIDYCSFSDLWWVNPRPNKIFYEIIYNNYFYNSPIPDQFGYKSREIDGSRRSKKAILNWDDIENNSIITNKHSLLEIGCSSGEFLFEAKNRGWKNVLGIEIDSVMLKLAEKKGISIKDGFFEEQNFGKNTFDLIFADNVIEHVFYPLKTLKKCNSIQNVGDKLILRLPETEQFGPRLKLIDHTYHFTRKSIEKLLKMSGYNVEKILYSGTFYGSNYSISHKQRIINMTVISIKEGI